MTSSVRCAFSPSGLIFPGHSTEAKLTRTPQTVGWEKSTKNGTKTRRVHCHACIELALLESCVIWQLLSGSGNPHEIMRSDLEHDSQVHLFFSPFCVFLAELHSLAHGSIPFLSPL